MAVNIATGLPPQTSPLVDAKRTVEPVWYQYFVQILARTGGNAGVDIATVQAEAEAAAAAAHAAQGTANTALADAAAAQATANTAETTATTAIADATTALASATASLKIAANLSDLASVPTARTNLGLKVYATANQGQLPGTTTNDNAAAGNIGEYIESVVPAASAVALTTLTPANVTSFVLTPGDWDVEADAYFALTATTTIELALVSLSTVTNTVSLLAGDNGFAAFPVGTTLANVQSANANVGPKRFSVAAATTLTVYMVVESRFGVSTNSAWGILRVRRVR